MQTKPAIEMSDAELDAAIESYPEGHPARRFYEIAKEAKHRRA